LQVSLGILFVLTGGNRAGSYKLYLHPSFNYDATMTATDVEKYELQLNNHLYGVQ